MSTTHTKAPPAVEPIREEMDRIESDIDDPMLTRKVDERYCEVIARTFSSKRGIRVRFGQHACTDANTSITLPYIYSARWIADGILDHETLHVKRDIKNKAADKPMWKDIAIRCIDEGSKESKYRGLKIWANIVEDCSIETEGAGEYAGVALNLRTSREMMIRIMEKTDIKLSPVDAIGKAFIAETMGPSLRESSNGTLAEAAEFVHKHLGDLMGKARHIGYTENSYNVAREICDRLAELRKFVEEVMSNTSSDEAEGDNEAGSTEGEGVGSGDKIEGGNEDVDDNDEQKEHECNDGDDSPDNIEKGSDDTIKAKDAEQLAKDLDKLNRDLNSLKEDEDTGTFNDEMNKIADEDRKLIYAASPEALAADHEERPEPNSRRFQALERYSDKVTSALIGKFRLTLLSIENSRTLGLKSGKIHAGSLHRLAKFNTRVFKRETSRTIGFDDTIVTILIDQSGSMHTRIDRVASAVIALAKALNQLNVKFEILGWTNEGSSYGHGKGYSRMIPFRFFVYKTFAERWELEKERIGSMKSYSQNADGEAIEFAYNRMNERHESRKILFVLSDGLPACTDHDAQVSYLKRVIRRVEKSSTKLIGIGIETVHVHKYYRHNATCNDLSQLPGKLFKTLRETMNV